VPFLSTSVPWTASFPFAALDDESLDDDADDESLDEDDDWARAGGTKRTSAASPKTRSTSRARREVTTPTEREVS
jgi:hypothetical protein